MPTPLPDLVAPLLPPPDRKEVVHITRGLKTAMQPSDGLTELQGHVLTAITASMTGFEIELDELEPLGPVEDLGHIIPDTPDREVAERVHRLRRRALRAERNPSQGEALAAGSASLVAADIERETYITQLDLSAFTALSSTGPSRVTTRSGCWLRSSCFEPSAPRSRSRAVAWVVCSSRSWRPARSSVGSPPMPRAPRSLPCT